MDLLNDFCRLCAEKLDHSLSKNIFAPEYSHLRTTITQCMQPDIFKHEGYPKNVCFMCVWKLNILLDMREKWLAAVEVFEEIKAKADKTNSENDNNRVMEVEKLTEDISASEVKINKEHTKRSVLKLGKFVCAMCHLRFHDSDNLIMHIKTHKASGERHKNNTNSRPPDQPTSHSPDRLTQTVLSVSPENCRIRFVRSLVKVPQTLTNGAGYFPCQLCSSSFPTKTQLLLHYRTFLHTRSNSE